MTFTIMYVYDGHPDGYDVFETEMEYIRAREHRKDEGWKRIGYTESNGNRCLVMAMAGKVVA